MATLKFYINLKLASRRKNKYVIYRLCLSEWKNILSSSQKRHNTYVLLTIRNKFQLNPSKCKDFVVC